MFTYCCNNPCVFSDPSGCYSRNDAVSYAEEWYDKKNEDYYYYSRGDCANFVSQCLAAGGLSMTQEWFCNRKKKGFWRILSYPPAWFFSKYRYDWKSGEAWRLADDQFRYFSNPDNGYINGEVITISSKEDIARVANQGQIQAGDLLYFSKDGVSVHHATIITNVSNGIIKFGAHTSPQFDCDLADKIGSETIFIIRISDDA